jgi:hypothetical protein
MSVRPLLRVATVTQPPNAPKPESADAAPEKKKPREKIARVMIRGEGIIFERKKLWPQGAAQTLAGQCAFSVSAHKIALEEAKAGKTATREQLKGIERELRQAEEEYELAKGSANGGSQVIEALVHDMYLIDGDAESGRPATIEILGVPFGQWEAKNVSITATIPQANAFWETIWPMSEFKKHAAMLEAEAAEVDQDDTTDDDDDDDDDDDGDDEGDEGDDAPNGATP